MNDEYTDNETQNIVNDTENTVSDTTTPVEETIETVTSETPASETGAVNTNEQKTEAFESKASEETTDNTTSDNPAGINDQNQAGADPYSKYNYYTPNQYPQGGYQGYQAQGYQNQPYQAQYQGQQAYTQGQNYNGTYQQPAGYPNAPYQGYTQAYAGNGYGQPPYSTGQPGYEQNVNSIYPGNAPHRRNTKKAPGKAGKFFAGLAMSVAFGLVAAGVFVLITYIYKQQNPELFNNTNPTVQVTTSDNKNSARLNLDPAVGTNIPSTNVIDGATFTGTDVSKVVEENMSAIVAIDCITETYNYWYGPYESPSAGSGIIIKRTDTQLMIATNNHVVSGTKDIKVKFIDGTSAPATVKGQDKVADLAVLEINLSDLSESTLNAITVAKTGNSDSIKVGEMAIAIGNALGYGQSVTVGYISGKDRDLTIDGQTFTGLLQTDAAINPGNSGGALLNINGEVIGINNAKISGSYVEGMGYAIPITRAEAILNEFASRETLAVEEQGFLGINYEPITESMSKRYNWPVGIYVSNVLEDSAAEKAGIIFGDIITEIDGYPTTEASALLEKLRSTRAGTTVTLTIQRQVAGVFEEMKIPVTLGNRPAEDSSSEKKNTEPETSAETIK